MWPCDVVGVSPSTSSIILGRFLLCLCGDCFLFSYFCCLRLRCICYVIVEFVFSGVFFSFLCGMCFYVFRFLSEPDLSFLLRLVS